MDTGIVSLIISGLVAAITVAKFLFSLVIRKESVEEKFAKAETILDIKKNISDIEDKFAKIETLIDVKKDISDIEDKLEDYGAKIGNLQMQGAVLNSQMTAQLRELEKLGNKLDEWRTNE